MQQNGKSTENVMSKTSYRIQYNSLDYELSLLELDRGGNGIVYEIINMPQEFEELDRRLNIKPLVIKILSPKCTKEDSVQRFKNEIEALRYLSGRTVNDKPIATPIILFNTNSEQPWYIMPKLKSLASIKLRITNQKIIDILISLAISLKEIHRLGYAHRDIKPSNILLTEFDHPVWADFGLVKYDKQEEITPINSMIGPKFYIANEVGHIPQKEVTITRYQQADIKSFSKLIFAIMKGGAPPMEGVYYQFLSAFEGSDIESIINPILDCIARGGELVPQNRCSLDDIIKNLIKFKLLLQDTSSISKLELQNMAFERTTKSFCSKTKPLYYPYEGDVMILFLKDLQKVISNTFNITFSIEGVELTYKCNGLQIDKESYYFFYHSENKKDDIFYFKPSQIKIYPEKKLEIETTSYLDKYGIRQKLSSPFSGEETIAIIEDSMIRIEYIDKDTSILHTKSFST